MNVEIERKFLVKSDAFKAYAFEKHFIKQGFITLDPDKMVRVRISGDKAWITIKGAPNHTGTSRIEWEKEIRIRDAEELWTFCKDFIVEKTRYLVRSGDHLFEVDEFIGKNKGLVVAEIELKEENEHFESPDWLGPEVTGDDKYFNVKLAQYPFNTWLKQ